VTIWLAIWFAIGGHWNHPSVSRCCWILRVKCYIKCGPSIFTLKLRWTLRCFWARQGLQQFSTLCVMHCAWWPLRQCATFLWAINHSRSLHGLLYCSDRTSPLKLHDRGDNWEMHRRVLAPNDLGLIIGGSTLHPERQANGTIDLVICPGADLRWGRGHVLPRFTCCPQIQKPADHSDVIFEVPKCSKMQIFRGTAPDPTGELTALPIPLANGERALCSPPKNPTPALGPSGLVSTCRS